MFFLAEYGPARVIETTETHGTVEGEFRSWYAGADNKARLDDLTSYVRSAYRAKSLEKYEHTASTDFSKPYSMSLEMKDAPVGFTDLQSSAVGVKRLQHHDAAALVFQRSPGRRGRREVRGAHNGRGVRAFRHRVELPHPPAAGLPGRASCRADGVQTLGPAKLGSEFKLAADGTVHATWRFDTVKRRYTPAETNALLAALRELKDAETQLISFDQVGVALRADGDFKGALHANDAADRDTSAQGCAPAARGNGVARGRTRHARAARGAGRDEARTQIRARVEDAGLDAAARRRGTPLRRRLRSRRRARRVSQGARARPRERRHQPRTSPCCSSTMPMACVIRPRRIWTKRSATISCAARCSAKRTRRTTTTPTTCCTRCSTRIVTANCARRCASSRRAPRSRALTLAAIGAESGSAKALEFARGLSDSVGPAHGARERGQSAGAAARIFERGGSHRSQHARPDHHRREHPAHRDAAQDPAQRWQGDPAHRSARRGAALVRGAAGDREECGRVAQAAGAGQRVRWSTARTSWQRGAASSRG